MQTTETAWKHSYRTLQNWVTGLNIQQLSPVSVMTPIANCSLTLQATLNTCCIYSSPLNASITTLSHFVNSHNFQLPECTSVLTPRDKNVIMRKLYCDADNSIFYRAVPYLP